jgi:hypothetical protein
MTALCEFQTVEEFWRYFNHIPTPSQVFFDGECRKKVGESGKTVEEYSLFKKGIEPEWGDPANVTGGEWFCRQFFEGTILDLYWLNLVLAVVGETMDSTGDIVNGCRIVDKSRQYPMFKLELWLKIRDKSTAEEIKQRLLDIVTDGQPPGRKGHPKFEWKDHSA